MILKGLKKSIRGKLILLGIIPIVLFILLTVLYTLPSIRDNIYHEKEVQTRDMVDVSLSILEHFYLMETEGEMSRAEAQEAARESIRAVRFGEQMEDYYWINDFHPRVVMHPFRPDLEGEDVSGVRDPDGLDLFVEFVRVCEAEGAGYVPYQWQYYDDTDRIEPKLSYVAAFEPWEWIIGTGVYINDVDEIVASERNVTLLFTLGVAFATILIILIISNRFFVRPLGNLVEQVAKVGEGDFTAHVETRSEDEIGYLAETINKTIQNLKNLMRSATQTSNKVSESSESLSASSQEMSASLEQVAASTNEFSRNAQQLSESAQEMSETSAEISKSAGQGNNAIDDAVNQMQRITEMVRNLKDVIVALDERSQEIGKIVGTIKGIADQTNLLALNAAIEAARAGDQGRGFAVVADEVRKLAEQSATAASEITELITATQDQSKKAVVDMDKGVSEVNTGTEVIQSTGEIFKKIINSVENIARRVEDLAAASEQISSGSEQMSASVQEQTATMGEVSSSAEELRIAAEELANELNRFQY